MNGARSWVLCAVALLAGIDGPVWAASDASRPIPLDRSATVRPAKSAEERWLERYRPDPLPGPILLEGGGVLVPPGLARVTVQPEAGEDYLEPPPGPGPLWRGPIGANVRLNDTALDPAFNCNSETSIAALGPLLVAGWNDGLVFPDSPGASGYSYSTDGGATWVDGGILPATPPAVYGGDPVLAVDGAGNFYYSSLYSPDGIRSALAVNRGRFAGGVLIWDPPVVPVAPRTSDLLDKEWLAVDPVDGTVYLAYTRFSGGGGSRIEITRSLDLGATWSPPLALSTPLEGTQGARIVVGPDHEVYVMWYAFDLPQQRNYLRIRRSLTRGQSFDPAVTLPAPLGVVTNFGSGPPGFNRPRGIGLPALAVDRSTGRRRGRLYAVWEETVDYRADPLGTLGPRSEVEPNGMSDSASAVVIGETIQGTLESIPDRDWFRFDGEAGQTVILYLVPASTNAAAPEIRLHCGGGGVANRVMNSNLGQGYGLIVYTLPNTGTYFIETGLGNFLGDYLVHTGWHTPDPARDRARDTRDVMLQTSADGITWDPLVRVNRDSEGSDDAFPEVAVDAHGAVWVDWYGHRSDPCRIRADVFYARSVNGGRSFHRDARANDGPAVNWNEVATNLAPNMGDYMALVADGCRVYANFSDGREGSPDSWLALLADCPTPLRVAALDWSLEATGVRVVWQAFDDVPFEATVERRAENGPWEARGIVEADAHGRFEFRDEVPGRGVRSGYRLSIDTGAGTQPFGEIWIEVAAATDLALRVRSNASTAGTIALSCAIGGGGDAHLEVFDAAGRRMRSIRWSESDRLLGGRRDIEIPGLLPGLYWARLSSNGGTATARAVVLH